MTTQLNPPIRLFVVGKGPGNAVVLIDYGPDWDLWWVVILDRSGEIWTAANPDVRGVTNATMGRPAS